MHDLSAPGGEEAKINLHLSKTLLTLAPGRWEWACLLLRTPLPTRTARSSPASQARDWTWGPHLARAEEPTPATESTKSFQMINRHLGKKTQTNKNSAKQQPAE